MLARYTFDDDREVAADEPLDLAPYPTTDELPAASAAPDDWLREMRPVDFAWATFLVGLAIGWLVAMAIVAWHITQVGL